VFRIFRQVLFWFDIEQPVQQFAPDRFPIFIWELQDADQGIYGFPAIDGSRGGMKLATEQYAAATTPDAVSREVDASETSTMYESYVAPNLSGVRPTCIKTAVCLYTVTPDFGFVIDWLPGSKRIVVASPCSGHGFKHSAAIGEILADLATQAASAFDLHPFGFGRFRA
jgi:sarcosine oxidase